MSSLVLQPKSQAGSKKSLGGSRERNKEKSLLELAENDGSKQSLNDYDSLQIINSKTPVIPCTPSYKGSVVNRLMQISSQQEATTAATPNNLSVSASNNRDRIKENYVYQKSRIQVTTHWKEAIIDKEIAEYNKLQKILKMEKDKVDNQI